MKILIREIREDDIWMLHKWINDPEIIRFTNSFRPISEMEQRQWFGNTDYFRNNYVFGIEDKDKNKLVGSCGLYDHDSVSHKCELRMKVADLEYRGKGVGKAALKQLLEFGFQDLNLYRIWLRVLSNNEAAVKLYTQAGFVREGCFREDMFIKNKYHDTFIMGLLRSEFNSL